MASKMVSVISNAKAKNVPMETVNRRLVVQDMFNPPVIEMQAPGGVYGLVETRLKAANATHHKIQGFATICPEASFNNNLNFLEKISLNIITYITLTYLFNINNNQLPKQYHIMDHAINFCSIAGSSCSHTKRCIIDIYLIHGRI